MFVFFFILAVSDSPFSILTEYEAELISIISSHQIYVKSRRGNTGGSDLSGNQAELKYWRL